MAGDEIDGERNEMRANTPDGHVEQNGGERYAAAADQVMKRIASSRLTRRPSAWRHQRALMRSAGQCIPIFRTPYERKPGRQSPDNGDHRQ